MNPAIYIRQLLGLVLNRMALANMGYGVKTAQIQVHGSHTSGIQD